MTITEDQKSELKSIIHGLIAETEEELQQLHEYTRPVAPDVSIGWLMALMKTAHHELQTS